MWVPPKSKHGPHPCRAFVFEFPKARCPTGIDSLGGDRGGASQHFGDIALRKGRAWRAEAHQALVWRHDLLTLNAGSD